jgi:hypothetical protein
MADVGFYRETIAIKTNHLFPLLRAQLSSQQKKE